MRDRPLGEGRDEAEWNFVIDEDPNIDFHDELRAASRVGRRKGKGVRHFVRFHHCQIDVSSSGGPSRDDVLGKNLYPQRSTNC